MAKGLRSDQDLCPASRGQQGRIRKNLNKNKWSAQFEFKRHGEWSAFEGPVRTSRVAAEKDREFIAAAMTFQPRSSRIEAASVVIKRLRIKRDGPGLANTIRDIGVDELANIGWEQLYNLANQIPGITRNKTKQNGKWDPKACNELKEGLLVLKKAQALPGRMRSIKVEAPVSDSTKAESTVSDVMDGQPRRAKKRPASRLQVSDSIKVRPMSVCDSISDRCLFLRDTHSRARCAQEADATVVSSKMVNVVSRCRSGMYCRNVLLDVFNVWFSWFLIVNLLIL